MQRLGRTVIAWLRVVAVACTLSSLVFASALGRDALAVRVSTLACAAHAPHTAVPTLRAAERRLRLRVRSAGVLRPSPAEVDDDGTQIKPHDVGDCHPFPNALATIPPAFVLPERVDEVACVAWPTQTDCGLSRRFSGVTARGPPTTEPSEPI